MASPWINTFETLPALNQDCWIRVPYYYGAPVWARYVTMSAPFGPTKFFRVKNTAGLNIPFYMVPRWKPYP